MLNNSVRQPKHIAVAESIQKMVRVDRLRPGDRLPSETNLADRFGVAYMTVRAANKHLVKKGLLKREQGRGTFIKRLIINEKISLTKSFGIHKIAYGFVTSPAPKARGYYYNPEPYKSLKKQFQRRNIDMVRFYVDPEIDDEPFPSHILDDSFPVVILEGYYIEQEFIRRILRRGKKVIIFGNQLHVPGVPRIEVDYGLVTYEITKKLAEQGAEHIWLVTEPFDLFYTRQMFDQYRQALTDLKISPLLFCPVDPVNLEPLARQLKDMRSVLSGRTAMIYATRLYLLGKEFAAFDVDLGGIDFVSTSLLNSSDEGVNGQMAGVERLIPYGNTQNNEQHAALTARMVVDMAEGRPLYSVIFKPEVHAYPFEDRYGLDVSWAPVLIDMETGQELADYPGLDSLNQKVEISQSDSTAKKGV